MSKLKGFVISAVCVLLAVLACFGAGCEKQPDYEALYNDNAWIASESGSNVCEKYLSGNKMRVKLSRTYSGVCGIQGYINELKNYDAVRMKLEFRGRKIKLVFTQGSHVHVLAESVEGGFSVNGEYVEGNSFELTASLGDKNWMDTSAGATPPSFKAVCLNVEYFELTYEFIRNGTEPPQPSSDYEKIRAAYREAGYTVDLKTEDLDANTANLVEMMQNMYEQLGYGMCFISKNLSNAAEMELYMLVSADTEEAAIQFVDELSSYQYERNGKNVIVSLNVMTQNPNFGPFNGI